MAASVDELQVDNGIDAEKYKRHSCQFDAREIADVSQTDEESDSTDAWSLSERNGDVVSQANDGWSLNEDEVDIL